jgi:transposase
MRKRGQAVYLSHEGKRVTQIARELECSKNSVYSWLKAYQEEGITGLEEPTHSSKLTPEQLNQVMEISHRLNPIQPETRGAKIKRIQSRWSFRKMAQWIKDNWNIKISHERLRQMVRQSLTEG